MAKKVESLKNIAKAPSFTPEREGIRAAAMKARSERLRSQSEKKLRVPVNAPKNSAKAKAGTASSEH